LGMLISSKYEASISLGRDLSSLGVTEWPLPWVHSTLLRDHRDVKKVYDVRFKLKTAHKCEEYDYCCVTQG
jgi:hypothetical protein